MQMESHASDAWAMDEGLERLRLDLLNGVSDYDEMDEYDQAEVEVINYAALEFELDRMKKRLAIWQIFMNYMRDGAKSWTEVQESLTQRDFEEIVRICDGVSLRDLLLDEG